MNKRQIKYIKNFRFLVQETCLSHLFFYCFMFYFWNVVVFTKIMTTFDISLIMTDEYEEMWRMRLR